MEQEPLTVDVSTEFVAAELETLLDDSEWVDAEFFAIMHASGFGDRVIVGAVRPSEQRSTPWESVEPRISLDAEGERGHPFSRVRSPPRP